MRTKPVPVSPRAGNAGRAVRREAVNAGGDGGKRDRGRVFAQNYCGSRRPAAPPCHPRRTRRARPCRCRCRLRRKSGSARNALRPVDCRARACRRRVPDYERHAECHGAGLRRYPASRSSLAAAPGICTSSSSARLSAISGRVAQEGGELGNIDPMVTVVIAPASAEPARAAGRSFAKAVRRRRIAWMARQHGTNQAFEPLFGEVYVMSNRSEWAPRRSRRTAASDAPCAGDRSLKRQRLTSILLL